MDGHTDHDNDWDLSHVDIYSTHTYHNSWPPASIVDTAAEVHSHGKAFSLGEYPWTGKDIIGFRLSWTLAEMLSAIQASRMLTATTSRELFAPLARGGAFALHWPGDNADMVTRATQLANHALRMRLLSPQE